MDERVIWRRGPELTATELHDLLRLRVDVFVVEQECAYPEVDGRDLLDTTHHAWVTASKGAIAASLRLLLDHDPPQIGRVVTAPEHRGKRLAERLLHEAHAQAGETGTFLEAQTYLVGWYERQGWQISGEEFVEDGIPHTPMRRPGS
ncbi:MAG: GNAT family N-acetyltransferase [Actinomycetota bacterium]